MFKSVFKFELLRERHRQRDMEALAKAMRPKSSDCDEDWQQEYSGDKPARHTDLVAASGQVC